MQNKFGDPVPQRAAVNVGYHFTNRVRPCHFMVPDGVITESLANVWRMSGDPLANLWRIVGEPDGHR